MTVYSRAAAPPMISLSSEVICVSRARLYFIESVSIISPAFSVAPFIATIRKICSLTAASRKHLNSRALNAAGTICSRISPAEGRNS